MSTPGRRLYIGRIPQEATRTDIEKYFGRYGTLLDVRIMAGFGFLEYDQVRDAEDAVHDLNGREFMGDRLIVEFAKAPRGGREMYGGGGGGSYGGGGPRRSGFRLIVKGISHETSWQDLKDFARQAGNVIRADVDRNMPGEGLIEYSSQDDADNALRKLDGTDLKGMVVTLFEDRPGGGRRDRSRSPSYRDRGDRGDRDRRGGYDRERRRSPPSRDERDRDRDRGYDRKERDRSRDRSRERSARRETVDEPEKA